VNRLKKSPPFSHPEKRRLYSAARDAARQFLSTQRHRLLWSAGAFFALLALALYFHTGQVPRDKEAQFLAETSAANVAPPIPELKEVVGSFKRNQTITQVLMQEGIPIEVVHEIVDSARPVYDLAKVKAEQLYYLYFTQEGKFSNFRYPVDNERYLTVYHDAAENRMVPVMKNYQYETRVERISGEIESSLFASILDIGENDQLALDLADIFGSDIDFYTDLQKGDSYEALVEKKYLDGKFSKYGSILVADFTNQQKVFTGILFEDEHGKPAFFAPDGKALKKSFLKSPLKFGRITSRFSNARLHPILKIVRPHLGVDYAAPTGTPVQSVASGIVLSAGRNGGYGKSVRIRHAGGFETRYSHLSRIAVKPGARVAQGEIIGNVGATGLATGPHLDFRIQQHGKAINPSKVIFPPGAPVSASQFGRFAVLRDKLIDDLRTANVDIEQASSRPESAPK
jgi:murein DD-endopeptidase MepM/ murein hydrolase activator NlpD